MKWPVSVGLLLCCLILIRTKYIIASTWAETRAEAEAVAVAEIVLFAYSQRPSPFQKKGRGTSLLSFGTLYSYPNSCYIHVSERIAFESRVLQ